MCILEIVLILIGTKCLGLMNIIGIRGAGEGRLGMHTLCYDFDGREPKLSWESDVEVIYGMLSLCLTNCWGGFLFISAGELY